MNWIYLAVPSNCNRNLYIFYYNFEGKTWHRLSIYYNNSTIVWSRWKWCCPWVVASDDDHKHVWGHVAFYIKNQLLQVSGQGQHKIRPMRRLLDGCKALFQSFMSKAFIIFHAICYQYKCDIYQLKICQTCLLGVHIGWCSNTTGYECSWSSMMWDYNGVKFD